MAANVEADLLELFTGDCRDRYVEACHARAWKVLCNLVHLAGILQWIVVMREVEAAQAVSLQLYETWSDNVAFEVDGISRDIAYILSYLTSRSIDGQILDNQLSLLASSAIDEGCEVACHVVVELMMELLLVKMDVEDMDVARVMTLLHGPTHLTHIPDGPDSDAQATTSALEAPELCVGAAIYHHAVIAAVTFLFAIFSRAYSTIHPPANRVAPGESHLWALVRVTAHVLTQHRPVSLQRIRNLPHAGAGPERGAALILPSHA